MPYLSQYTLSLSEVRTLRCTDTYSLHRLVYSLFADIRQGAPDNSGILFADKGGNAQGRKLLILSERKPQEPKHGHLESKILPDTYLKYPAYHFEITINPVRRENKTGKLIPIRGAEAISDWFCAKALTWGFLVHQPSLSVANVHADIFTKGGHNVTLGKATLTGFLKVTEAEKFANAVFKGLGRARSFGCGLLQIVPSPETTSY